MKHYLAITVALLAMSLSAFADVVREPVDYEKLPPMAQKILETYFTDLRIESLEKVKDGVKKYDYEVRLADGFEIVLDKEGNWSEVTAPEGAAVPTRIVPGKIVMHVRNNFKGATVTKIERDHKRNYTLFLSTGQELHFDGDYKPIE